MKFLNIGIIVFANFYLLLILAIIGNNILRYVKIRFESSIEELLLSSTLGVGCMIYIIFMLLSSRLFYWQVFFCILFFVSLLTFSTWKRIWKLIKITAGGVKRYLLHSDWIEKSIFLFLGFIVLANFVLSLMPPEHIDVFEYHFLIPKINAYNHGFIKTLQPLGIHNWYYMELFNSLGFIFLGETMAKNMCFLVSMLAIFGFYLVSRLLLDRAASIVATLLFISLPENMYLIASGKNDFGMLLFSLCGIYCLIKWFKKEEAKWLILAAIFVGFALGIKITSLTLIIFINILLFLKHRSSLKYILKRSFIFNGIIFITILPILIKNIIFWSYPLHPYLYSFFNIKTEIAKELAGYTPRLLYDLSGIDKMFKLFNTFKFTVRIIPDYLGHSQFLHICLLFLPLALLVRIKKRGYTLLLLIILLAVLNIALLRVICYRYLLIVAALSMIMVVYIISEIIGMRKRVINNLIRLSLFLIFLTSIWNYRFIVYRNPFIQTHILVERSIVADTIPIQNAPIIIWINQNILLKEKLLFLANDKVSMFQYRYYIRTDLLTQNIFVKKILAQDGIINFYREIKNQNIKYIVYFISPKDYISENIGQTINEEIDFHLNQKKYFKPLFIDNSGVVYEVL